MQRGLEKAGLWLLSGPVPQPAGQISLISLGL